MILDDLAANIYAILTRIKASELSRYDELERSLPRTKVDADRGFQRTFKGYYRVRGRGPEWCTCFFSVLEREKRNRAVAFRNVLEEGYRGTGRVERAFSSKLVATIRPELPVCDKYVCENLGLAIPGGYEPAERRVDRLVGLYDDLCRQVADLVKSAAFAELRKHFDSRHRDYSHLTDTKKLDLLLWKYRPGQKG